MKTGLSTPTFPDEIRQHLPEDTTWSEGADKVAVICTNKNEIDELGKAIGCRPCSFCSFGNGRTVKLWTFDMMVIIACHYGDIRGSDRIREITTEIVLEYCPNYIGMIGVCGGCKLGDVIVAKSASVTDFGIDKLQHCGYAMNGEDDSGHGVGVLSHVEERMRGRISQIIEKIGSVGRTYDVHLGVMRSYPQNIEGKECLPGELRCVSDRESVAFFEDGESVVFFETVTMLAKIRSVKALHVVKGTSNVGNWDVNDIYSPFHTHNTAELYAGLSGGDNAIVNEAYNEFASKNAAQVMAHMILAMFDVPY